ncbi:MMPL family transporter [Streptomyces beihaiensis]|uniref:MMPL family transporter n=1 Tax=Streptomyces beihaiensis TaxID=2984495 RepID=A0ABT3TTH5_9ACTN|nr:MMPL family transporter [Streptomyces beihaiensis]MCX3060317.1 MMPL family transporter [Streptomyces beihaiensis]
MFDRLSRLVLRSPRKVVLLTILLVFLAGAAGGGLQSRLTMGGYESSGTESSKAAEQLQQTFKQGEPNVLLLIKDKRGVDDPAVAKAGHDLSAKLAAQAHVTNVTSYWDAKSPALRSRTGKEAVVLGRITGNFDDQIDRVKKIDEAFTGKVDGLQVKTGGSAMMWQENTKQSQKDAMKAESLVFPILMVVLVIIFGSALVALLPVTVAFAAMLLSMAALFLITFFGDTSSVVENTTTFLGIGLGVDYCLLFVTRYREELRLGKEINDAITITLRTAGRTIAFSALTVAVAFVGLLVLPFTMMRSLAIGCMTTALVAAFSAIVLAPALLKWIGPRVDKWRLIKRKQDPAKDGGGFWHSLSTAVMRRPVRVAILVLAVAITLGLPAASMKLRLPDESVLPSNAKSAQVAQVLKKDFNTREQQALNVVAAHSGSPQAKSGAIDAYARKLSSIKGVTRVDAFTGSYAKGAKIADASAADARFGAAQGTYLSVVPSVDPYSSAGNTLVHAVRDTKAPFDVKVGGPAAVSTDTFHTLKKNLPIAAVVLFLGMFVLLFLLTGSILLPLQSIVLTGISLTATFGALVFIFQEGHMAKLFGDFIVTGGITWTVPIMSFGMAFALSMDYQVFMLSRIKEEYDRTGDNELAVASGLERVGKVVTYAAVLLSLVFLVLISSGISYMKALGLGMALAILMDATLIRGGLLPALMKLFGRANWWAPKPLQKLHSRFGISESEEGEPAPAAAAQAPSTVPSRSA